MNTILLRSPTGVTSSQPVNGRRILSLTFEAIVWVWRSVDKQRSRRQLAQLEDWQLADLGLSRTEAQVQSRKWFWQ